MSAEANGNRPEPEPAVIGYCVHCRIRRTMQAAIQVCNRRGNRDLKGHCAVCGKPMYRLGGWDSIAAAAQRAQAEQDEPQAQSIPGFNRPDDN